jgi:toxin ParE1/3/4
VNVEWLPLAKRDRDDHLNYIGEHNPWAAIEIGDAFEAAIRRLCNYTEIGRAGRVKGTRELVVAGTPYLIAYRVEANTVVVIRLLHGAQKWPSQFGF